MIEKSPGKTKEFLPKSSAAPVFATYRNPTRFIHIMWSKLSCLSVFAMKFENSRRETRSENHLKSKGAKPGFTMWKLVYTWLKFRSWSRKPLCVNAAIAWEADVHV